jgi:hypothetical protein
VIGVRRVIDPDYAPDVARLAGDYLAHNPTRNRPLDLLPVLAFTDPGLLARHGLGGQKARPRPCLNYRLPNSLIDDPHWSIAAEWNRWVLVERLAGDYRGWDNTVMGYLADRRFHHVDEDWVPALRGAAPAA